MIPGQLTVHHLYLAMKRIEREGVPRLRRSRNYCLAFNGRHYPPKYVIAVACMQSLGITLDSEDFGGGDETNDFLSAHGLSVVSYQCGGSVAE